MLLKSRPQSTAPLATVAYTGSKLAWTGKASLRADRTRSGRGGFSSPPIDGLFPTRNIHDFLEQVTGSRRRRAERKRMSGITPGNDPEGASLKWSFRGVHSSEELRKPVNSPRLQLFKILRKAGQNLEAELCRDQPASIFAKACDLERNLPDWERRVAKIYASSNGAMTLVKEDEAYRVVLEAARAAIACLQPLLSGNRENPLAQPEWYKLGVTVRAAVGYLNGEKEFPTLDTSQSAPPVSRAKEGT